MIFIATILSLSKISKRAEEKTILSDVSFDILPGSIIGFLGPNGAGKTTTLKIAAGLVKPTSGEVLVRGVSLTEQRKIAKQMMTFIPDNPLLYDELTGKEYIRFFMDLFAVDVPAKKVEDEIERFRFQTEYNKQILHYSLGNRKKLALLCAMLRRSPLLLLDEYISGLDPVNSILIREILREYVKGGSSILLSTHQLDIVKSFCDGAIFINEGSIVDRRTLPEILQDNDSIESYFLSQLQSSETTQKGIR
ncbi:ABC transporter ATP-binding protein [Paenibacillus humicus]|uniref:ABC transporter ATP-binding protein n=1 Tax=Paenibacillus humicus TaxID=412861 RepID=UPI003D2A54E9